MSEKKNEIVSIKSYGKKNRWNIGTILFGFIFLYLVFAVIMYLTKDRVTSYEVRQGSILKDTAFTGLVLRDETVYYAETDGYLNYFLPNGSRVGNGDNVYTLSQDPLPEPENTTENQQISVSQEDWSSIASLVQAFHETNNGQNQAPAKTLKAGITDLLEGTTEQSKVNRLSAFVSENGNEGVSVYQSPDDGVIEYSVDGYESINPDMITDQDILQHEYTKTEYGDNEKIKAGDPVYRMITSEQWTVVIKLTPEIEQEFREMEIDSTVVKVRFTKDNKTMNGSFKIINRGKDDAYGYLTFYSGMIRYANDRYLDIELILEDESGLKIPKTAVTEKEFYVLPEDYLTTGGASSGNGVLLQKGDSVEFVPVSVYYRDAEEGEYYITSDKLKRGDILQLSESAETYAVSEKKTLKGVYNINKGYAVFRQVQVLCESEEYYIIEEGNKYSLSNYDYIALYADSVQENQIINQ